MKRQAPARLLAYNSRWWSELADNEAEAQTFYREVPVDSVSLAFRRFFATNFARRCPACGRANVTEGLAGVKEQCPCCGSRFKRLEGNELISIPLGFFLASVVTFLAGLLLVSSYGFFEGITFVLLGVGLLTALLGWRPMRVLALWLLWIIGFVYPDDVEKGKTVRSRRAADADEERRQDEEATE